MAKLDVREYSTFYKIPIVDRVNYRDFRIYMSTKDYYTKEYGYSFLTDKEIQKKVFKENRTLEEMLKDIYLIISCHNGLNCLILFQIEIIWLGIKNI